jgi:hypothetical protein
MAEAETCPECGTQWRDGVTCRAAYEQMLAWEFEDISGAGSVHHLSVLSYNLQHPSVYSPQGLAYAKDLLMAFVARGEPSDYWCRKDRQRLDSGSREWRFTGQPAAYPERIAWPVTVVEVVSPGLEGYCERVRAWAQSVCAALRE